MAHRRTYPQRQIHKKRIKAPRNQGKLDRLDSLEKLENLVDLENLEILENLGNLENLVNLAILEHLVTLVLSFKGSDCFFELLVLFLENLQFVLQAIDGLLLVGAIA